MKVSKILIFGTVFFILTISFAVFVFVRVNNSNSGGNSIVPTTTPTGDCKVGGCSNQLCLEPGDSGVSTCEWREQYSCYRAATCERQTNGKCGWTMTNELASCLSSYK